MPLLAPETRCSTQPRSLLRGLCFVVLGVWLFTCADALAAAEPSFFDTTAKKSTKMKAFKKWNSALERYTREKAAQKEGKCGDKEMNKCNFEKWIKFLKGLKGKKLVIQIREINDYMNRAPYITDPVNWGKKDYWATPGEFMSKFGDCEDYAIAKYMSLRLLGYNEDDLRVVAVKDLNLKIGHAILVVFYKGKPYVLDNQIKQVMPASKIKHYLPVFSINQSAWWKHIPAG
ncbi:transglutaminase-like cysteine peptidase [Magnetovibrio sp. PR-2]|uniref:transglutaminase-like cysteine peptidase n=1 Tax=Magnetovibrio sp. PR-2 TaxID=3120356 RepID=UPI002FCE4AB4